MKRSIRWALPVVMLLAHQAYAEPARGTEAVPAEPQTPPDPAPDQEGATQPPAPETQAPPTEAAPGESPPAAPSLDERVDSLEQKLASQAEAQGESNAILDALKKIKLSGYIQGRFEYHDDSVQGLNAQGRPTQTSQFLVRRGRLKATYTGTYAEFMLQIDATGKGVVLKDAEATLIEPWTGQSIRLTVGQFKWPFGYEVLQSSSVREMPERSLVIRRLFPGERDRGVRLQWSRSFLRLSVALVNGNGTEDAVYGANDSNGWKDLVGRLGFDFENVVFGVSGYWGKALVVRLAMPNAMPPVLASSTEFDKSRVGADVQTYLDVPHLGGLALKGELIYGEELGSHPLGFYVLGVQNIGDSLGAFVRFDRYDADVDKSNDAVNTIGGGLQYFFSGNLKASAVYEHPMAEVADLSDDILTLQMQAMF